MYQFTFMVLGEVKLIFLELMLYSFKNALMKPLFLN